MSRFNLLSYFTTVKLQLVKNSQWRLGQTMFNVFGFDRPEQAEEIRGTEIDPFYADENIPKFLAYLETYEQTQKEG